MNLSEQFKKSYLNYFAGIFLPALISSISIPVIKRLLGAKEYGYYSIYYNGVLLLSVAITTWVSQSILRFAPEYENKNFLCRKALQFVTKTMLLFFVPIAIVAYYLTQDSFLATLISVVFLCNSYQLAFLSLAQSELLSKKLVIAETIRTSVFLLLGVFLLQLNCFGGIISMFCAIIISLAVSLFYLNRILNNNWNTANINSADVNHPLPLRKFLHYGLPLTAWFVFAQLITYTDKFLLSKYFGSEIQGNYQAIFDMLYRGITILVMPVLVTLMPLLSREHQAGNSSGIKKLLRKIIFYQILVLLVISASYFLFAKDLLFMLLKVPDNESYSSAGFLLIVSAFLWQMAMVIHKRHELELKTNKMLLYITLAFLAQLAFYYFFHNQSSFLVFPMGCLIASLCYLILVSIPPGFNTPGFVYLKSGTKKKSD